MLVHQGELDDDQQSLLNLIRTKGFSVKYMGDTKKEELRRFLFFLQVEKGMSLNDVLSSSGTRRAATTHGSTGSSASGTGPSKRPD